MIVIDETEFLAPETITGLGPFFEDTISTFRIHEQKCQTTEGIANIYV